MLAANGLEIDINQSINSEIYYLAPDGRKTFARIIQLDTTVYTFVDSKGEEYNLPYFAHVNGSPLNEIFYKDSVQVLDKYFEPLTLTFKKQEKRKIGWVEEPISFFEKNLLIS